MSSFESVQKWIEEVKEHAEPDIVIMLVGNKLDLCEMTPGSNQANQQQRMVPKHVAQ